MLEMPDLGGPPQSSGDPSALQLIADLQRAFDRMRGTSKYGFAIPHPVVLMVSDGGSRCTIEMRFRAGERYCCAEPGCYLQTWSRAWWNQFHEQQSRNSSGAPQLAMLEIRGVVEAGALLHAHRSGGPIASNAYSYTQIDSINDT